MPLLKHSYVLAAIVLMGCSQVHPSVPLADSDLRDTLATMARAHEQKTELAFYESLPWQRTPDPFHAFFVKMGATQADLLKELQTWAKTANSGKSMDLQFKFSEDSAGRAQKIIEARQEKLIRSDAKMDFTRDALMQMYEDYEWQISLIQALLPNVKDAGLKTYLQHSLKIHEEGSSELIGLLQRFKA